MRGRGDARGGAGWTECSLEWTCDWALFAAVAVADDLGASTVDPSWELPVAGPNGLAMRLAADPVGGAAARLFGSDARCGEATAHAEDAE